MRGDLHFAPCPVEKAWSMELQPEQLFPGESCLVKDTTHEPVRRGQVAHWTAVIVHLRCFG